MFCEKTFGECDSYQCCHKSVVKLKIWDEAKQIGIVSNFLDIAVSLIAVITYYMHLTQRLGDGNRGGGSARVVLTTMNSWKNVTSSST